MLTHLCHLRIIIGIKVDKANELNTCRTFYYKLVIAEQQKNIVIKQKKEVEDVAADNCCEHFISPCETYSVPEISRSTVALCEWVHCMSFR